MDEALQCDIKQALYDHILEYLPRFYTATSVSVSKHGTLDMADLPGVSIALMSDVESQSSLGDLWDLDDSETTEGDLLEAFIDPQHESIGAGFTQRVEVRIVTVNGDQREHLRLALKPTLFLAREALLGSGQFLTFRLSGGSDEMSARGPTMFYEYPWTIEVSSPLEIMREHTAIQEAGVTVRAVVYAEHFDG